MNVMEIAIVTPSFARDYELCRALNESVIQFVPAPAKHYIFVDRCDLALFRRLQGPRTVITAIEDILPRGLFKVPFSKKWWLSLHAQYPAKGWLIQQLAKLSAPHFLKEHVVVNMDSDVRFIRPVDPALFARDGRTRLYRKPGGIVTGMHHVGWHYNTCRLLGVEPDELPMDDYVGNMISWNRNTVLEACARVEAVTGLPWHIPFTRRRKVAEQLLYGLYVDKVVGADAANVWLDERSWCHTYWGPGPLAHEDVGQFVAGLQDDDVAFSIEGYTRTDDAVVQAALRLVSEQTGHPPVELARS
jgi:hypothetical protein